MRLSRLAFETFYICCYVSFYTGLSGFRALKGSGFKVQGCEVSPQAMCVNTIRGSHVGIPTCEGAKRGGGECESMGKSLSLLDFWALGVLQPYS